MNLILLLRDILKKIIFFFKQVGARLFSIKRSYPSSIDLTARLDVTKDLKLGKGSFIEKNATINSQIGKVEIGDYSGIGINSIVIGPVTIGNNVRISQNCFVTGENRIKDETSGILKQDDFEVKPVVVGDNVWIGFGAIILPGVTIGKDAIIGAGAVVTKDVTSGTVVVGNPAKTVKTSIS